MPVQRIQIQPQLCTQQQNAHCQKPQKLAGHVAQRNSARPFQRDGKGLEDHKIVQEPVQRVHTQRDTHTDLWPAAALKHGRKSGEHGGEKGIADNDIKICRSFL